VPSGCRAHTWTTRRTSTRPPPLTSPSVAHTGPAQGSRARPPDPRGRHTSGPGRRSGGSDHPTAGRGGGSGRRSFEIRKATTGSDTDRLAPPRHILGYLWSSAVGVRKIFSPFAKSPFSFSDSVIRYFGPWKSAKVEYRGSTQSRMHSGGLESAGFEQRAGDVVRQVPEPATRCRRGVRACRCDVQRPHPRNWHPVPYRLRTGKTTARRKAGEPTDRYAGGLAALPVGDGITRWAERYCI